MWEWLCPFGNASVEGFVGEGRELDLDSMDFSTALPRSLLNGPHLS